MGHPEVALLFLDNATRLDPANAMYAEVALDCLKAVQDWPEVLRRCEVYVGNSVTPPSLMYRAADAFRAYANYSRTQSYYRDSIRAVDEGFSRSSRSNGPENGAALPAIAAAYATKGLCLLQLGETQASLKVLEDAVARFPRDNLFLFLRGAVKQELDISDVLSDFRKAVDGGSDIAWPYIELRHATRSRPPGTRMSSIWLVRGSITFGDLATEQFSSSCSRSHPLDCKATRISFDRHFDRLRCSIH